MFEWDEAKAESNLRKHGVSFATAERVFEDITAITKPDPDHSEDEDRAITIGAAGGELIVAVIHTDRDGRVRIISARRATPRERAEYRRS